MSGPVPGPGAPVCGNLFWLVIDYLLSDIVILVCLYVSSRIKGFSAYDCHYSRHFSITVATMYRDGKKKLPLILKN